MKKSAWSRYYGAEAAKAGKVFKETACGRARYAALCVLAVLCVLGLCACKKETPVTTLPTVQRQETTVPETTVVTEPEVTEEVTQEPKGHPAEETTASGLRPEFKQAMDSYESFYNEYVDLLKQYKANPTDFSILTKYMSMLSKVEEIDAAFKAWDSSDMTSEELKYYLEVSTRIQKKLVDLF